MWVAVGSIIQSVEEKAKNTKTLKLDYFERKLDDKHRLTIPAEIRSEFASGVVITRGFQNYLHMYSKDVWEAEMEPADRKSVV